ncbi:MAG: phosphoglycerate kinase, partial [bacterium]
KNLKADKIVIGGAMALTIYRKMGKNIGKSLFEEIEADFLINNPKVLLPQSFVVVDDNFQNPQIKSIDEINQEIAVDSLPDENILSLIREADMIFWNGPLGIFEKGFDKGSTELLKTVKQNKQSKDKGFRAIGGGDTLRFFNEYIKKTGEKVEEFVDFVSTGGGATLEFLEKGTLEAIEYIQSQSLKI